MAVLEGKVEETRYVVICFYVWNIKQLQKYLYCFNNLKKRYVLKSEEPIQDLVFPGPCPELKQIEHFECTKGEVGHINDDLGMKT